jgi:glutathione S-transferase
MLKVWGRRSSFNLQKVMWLVEELGLPHEHIPAGGDFGLSDTPEFLAMNPHGRVPVIDDDGTVVWESQTSCVIWRRNTGAVGFGRTIRENGRSPSVGWIGRRRVCSRIF